MFGLFRSSVSATQLVSGICENFLPPIQTYLRLLCTDAKVAEAQNYGAEESALVYFIGMHAINSSKWNLPLKRKVLTAYAAHIASKIGDDHPGLPVEFFQDRFTEYERELMAETSGNLPFDGVANHFLNALGVGKKQHGALRIALGMQLLSQLTEITKILNDMNSKFKIA